MREHAAKGESGVRLLVSGHDAFLARMALTAKAERSIDAQYYIWSNDLTGQLFAQQLMEAADRGVRVRLLVDDMVFSRRDKGGGLLDAHPNIELRIFNPFSRRTPRVVQLITRFNTVSRRMHNKSFTVDGALSIVGGRNIGDEYFGANTSIDYGDLDALIVGPVVQEVDQSFDNYWNNALAYPMSTLHRTSFSQQEIDQKIVEWEKNLASTEARRYRDAVNNSLLAGSIRDRDLGFVWAPARIIDDEPEKLQSPRSATELQLRTTLKPYFDATASELAIISPYFVPTKAGTVYLCETAKRGVSVRILTNSLASTDVLAVHAGYRKYRKDLVAAGVELYEVDYAATRLDGRDVKWMGGSSKTSLHAKAFVFDRKQAFIGSYNLDPRSALENTEVGLVVDSPEIAEALASVFDGELDAVAYRLELVDGKLQWQMLVGDEVVTFKRDPHTSVMKRFMVRLIGILPVEPLL